MPGFVNAHTHLEYANYAGFGDGMPFGPWITTHIARKAPARRGGHARDRTARRARVACAPGVTTVADYSFSGAAATRAADAGLRAIVYLEVFARRPRPTRSSSGTRSAQLRRGDAARPDRHLAARALHLLARHLPVLPLARRAGRHAPRGERERDRVAPPRPRAARGDRHAPRPAAREAPGRRRSSPCSARSSSAPTASRSTTPRVALLAARDVPVAHCPRSNALLGCGIAPLTALRDGRRPRRARHRLARLDAVVRPVRGASRRDLRGARARAARRRAGSGRGARARHDRLGARPATRRGGGYADRRKARRSDGRVARREPVPSGRGSGCGGRVRRLSGPSARDDRRRTDPLPEGRRDRVARGTQHRKRRTGPNARKPATAPSVAATAEAAPARVAGAAVLPAAARPREVGVRAPRARVRARLRLPRHRLRLERDHRRAAERVQLRQGERRRRRSRASSSKTQKNPLDAKAWRDLATAYETKQRTNDAIVALAQYTGLRPKDARRARRAREPSTASRRARTRPDYQNSLQAAVRPDAAVRRVPAARRRRRSARRSTTRRRCRTRSRRRSASRRRRRSRRPSRTTRRRSENAEGAYQKLAKLTPKDPNAQYQLGQAADSAGDTKVALAAYKAVVKLVPAKTDPLRTDALQRASKR